MSGVEEAKESSSLSAEPRRRYQFSLASLLAVPLFITIVGAVGAWFGWPYACILAPIPIGVLLWRFGASLLGAAGVTVILCMLVALIIPELATRDPDRRLICMNNLSQMGKALLAYEAHFGAFPAPYTSDADGRPLVSWRALILPYLERQDIYAECCFDEPWDGPTNAELARIDLRFMRCPSDPDVQGAQTNYLAVVGPGTIWSTDESVSLDDVEDPTRTIVLVEVAGSDIAWMEPRDLSLEDALRGINAEPAPSISSGHPGCVNVLFADGHTEFLSERMALDELRDLLTFEKRVK